MPDGVNMPLLVAGCVWPCLLACAAVFNLPIAVSLFSGIAFGWWARDRLGAPAATTSVTAEAEVVSNAGGFAGLYKDPQACDDWEIKDACAVTAVRERDRREVRGWFEGSVLTLQFKKDRGFEATLRGCQLEWRTGAPSWIKK